MEVRDGIGATVIEPGHAWDRRTVAARLCLVLILALSAFLQFYRLNDWQHFQGDEGLIALAVRAIFVQHVFPVYGLALAVGSAHIGPLYDYLIALPLWLSGMNPTAGTAVNGVFQVLAVGLCYGLMTRYGGGRLAGLVAALVLATAQEVVYYSRFMWPNMFPCMVILIIWSLLGLRDGRQYHLALLGVWMGTALQLQPTGVLLVPFLALYGLLFRPPLRSVRAACLGVLAFLLLFAPAIVHDLTHGLVETRAWLAYSHHGDQHTDRALGHTLDRVAVLLQRLLGVRQGVLAALLGVALALGVVVRAVLPEGGAAAVGEETARGAWLARLLLLLCGVCLAGYLFFGSQLRPHYAMPLFPVPALALGLLAGRWSTGLRLQPHGRDGTIHGPGGAATWGGDARAPSTRDFIPGLPGSAAAVAPSQIKGRTSVTGQNGAGETPALPVDTGHAASESLPRVWRGWGGNGRRVAAVLVALALAASNTVHTWQAGFMLDRFQITLAPERSNRITLGQMRQVSAFIIAQAAGRPFNLVFVAPDDQPQAYQTLLLAGGARLSFHRTDLRFLVVQPADWQPAHWPEGTRLEVACAGVPATHFAAALVWKIADVGACSGAGPRAGRAAATAGLSGRANGEEGRHLWQ